MVRELEAEHVVDEDLAAVVGLGEAVGGRVEFGFGRDVLQAERIEIGVEMPAHPVGADHHQRADRIPGRLLDLAVG